MSSATETINFTLKFAFPKSVVLQMMPDALKSFPLMDGRCDDVETHGDTLYETIRSAFAQRLTEDERWALLRISKPSEGVIASLCSEALRRHGDLISEVYAEGDADLTAELNQELADRAKAKAEAEAKAEQDKMMADALAWRQLVADQEAKKAKRQASAPVASGGSVASSERPKAKKRPEGLTDAEWEADVARRERNARNSKASEERKKALGIETKPLTAEEKAAQALMTPEERKAILVAKKAETRRLVKEAEARLNRAQ